MTQRLDGTDGAQAGTAGDTGALPGTTSVQLQVESTRNAGVNQPPLFQLQVDGTPAATEAGLKQDIDSTVAALETELTALETQIASSILR